MDFKNLTECQKAFNEAAEIIYQILLDAPVTGVENYGMHFVAPLSALEANATIIWKIVQMIPPGQQNAFQHQMKAIMENWVRAARDLTDQKPNKLFTLKAALNESEALKPIRVS